MLTEFSPFRHMYAQSCTLRTYLRDEGCRLEDIYEGVPPLPQVPWHHDALSAAVLATEDTLSQVVDRMCHVQKSVCLRELHVVPLCSTDSPLYEGGAFMKEKAPWAWIEIAKLSRPLSRVGGRFFYAWHLRTAAAHYALPLPPKTLLKTRPLLAPRTAPASLCLFLFDRQLSCGPWRFPLRKWMICLRRYKCPMRKSSCYRGLRATQTLNGHYCLTYLRSGAKRSSRSITQSPTQRSCHTVFQGPHGWSIHGCGGVAPQKEAHAWCDGFPMVHSGFQVQVACLCVHRASGCAMGCAGQAAHCSMVAR